MNMTSHHPSKHQPGDGGDSRVTSSESPASVEMLKAKISSLEMLRVRACARNASESEHGYSSTALSKSIYANVTAADVNTYEREGSDMNVQILRIPTKSENCEPGPILNPASCASGLALIGGGGGGGGEGIDWNSALSLATLVERINDVQVQGNTLRRNSLLQNEDWGDLRYPQGQGNLFLGNGAT